MSEEKFDDQMIIESTPVRTIRNLKNRQSLTSIKGDAESEDSIERAYDDNESEKNYIEQPTHLKQKKNMEEYIKKVEQFSNEVKPNFKRKPQHTSATTIQIQRKQSQDDNKTTPSSSVHQTNQQKLNATDQINAAYGLGSENTIPTEQRRTGKGTSVVVPVSTYLKNNPQLSQQSAYGMNSSQIQSNEQSSTNLLPLNDKTNSLEQNQRRSFRRFKSKIATMNEMSTGQNNLTGREENATFETTQKMQYVNIDMDYALHFVMSKSKTIRDKIESENISQDFINRAIMESRSFKIEYNMFLQKQVSHKILSPEFKNVSKKMFEKLEKFFLDRMEKQTENIMIQQSYIKQSQNVQHLLKNRMQMLINEMNNPNKIQLSA